MASIYVGNLAFTVTEDELQQLFSQHGTVSSVTLVKDRETGRPRGFAFIEMPNADEATAAIKELDLHELGGRSMTVNPARPKAERPHRGNPRRR